MPVLRAAWIALVSWAILLSAWESGRLLQPKLSPIPIVGGATVSVLILALASLLLAGLPVWDDFIRCGQRGRLFWTFAITSAATAMAIVLLARALITPPTPLPIVVAHPSDPVVVRFGHSSFDSFLLPFFVNGQSSRCKVITRGAAPDKEAAERFLKYLVPALAGCSKKGARVAIDVLGFSSSAEFKNDCADDDRKALNLLLAEKRRTAIIQMIRDLDTARAIDIIQGDSTQRWDGYEDMEHHQKIDDGGHDAVDQARAILTRRVQIVLTNIGACAS